MYNIEKTECYKCEFQSKDGVKYIGLLIEYAPEETVCNIIHRQDGKANIAFQCHLCQSATTEMLQGIIDAFLGVRYNNFELK